MSPGRYVIAAATAAFLMLGTVSIVHFVGWSRLVSTSEAGAHIPIAFDDHALQFYYGRLGARNLHERGVTYGYDPSFMAGYPKSPIYYPSSKLYELSLAIFSGFDPGRVFDWTVFAMLAVSRMLSAVFPETRLKSFWRHERTFRALVSRNICIKTPSSTP